MTVVKIFSIHFINLYCVMKSIISLLSLFRSIINFRLNKCILECNILLCEY